MIRPTLCTLAVVTSTLFAHPAEHTEPGEAPSQVMVTGNGLYRFQTTPEWGELPEGKNLGPTHGGVAVDSAGNVYTSTDAEHGICKFDAEGTFVKSFGKDTAWLHSLKIATLDGKEFLIGAGAGNKAHKLTLEGERLATAPNDTTGEIPAKVQKKDKEGRLMINEDGSPVYDNPMRGTTAAVVDDAGNYYVACGYGTNFLHKFDANGAHIKTVGGYATWEERESTDKFRNCHGLSIDRRFDEPRLFIVDRENGRLLHYDLDLNYISTYAKHLRRPCSVDFHGDEAAVAELAGRVTILGKEGEVLAFLGDNPDESQRANFKVPAEEMTPNLFTAPHGISYDAEGNLIVQDWNKTGRLSKMRRLK